MVKTDEKNKGCFWIFIWETYNYHFPYSSEMISCEPGKSLGIVINTNMQNPKIKNCKKSRK